MRIPLQERNPQKSYKGRAGTDTAFVYTLPYKRKRPRHYISCACYNYIYFLVLFFHTLSLLSLRVDNHFEKLQRDKL